MKLPFLLSATLIAVTAFAPMASAWSTPVKTTTANAAGDSVSGGLGDTSMSITRNVSRTLVTRNRAMASNTSMAANLSGGAGGSVSGAATQSGAQISVPAGGGHH